MLDNRRVIKSVEYNRESKAIELSLNDGASLTIPVSQIQFDGSENRPTDAQLAAVQRWGGGNSIYFESLSEVLFLEDLKDGIYGDRPWMESLAVAYVYPVILVAQPMSLFQLLRVFKRSQKSLASDPIVVSISF